jgi:hypothetical protein
MSEGLPDWLPPLVRKRVCELLAECENKPQERAGVLKLATDHRMKRVWSYLLKRKRVDYRPSGYFHPVVDPCPDSDDVREGFAIRAEWMQHVGMRVLFERILFFVRPMSLDGNAIRSKLPLEQALAHARAAIEALDQVHSPSVKSRELKLAAHRHFVRGLKETEGIKLLLRPSRAECRPAILASLAWFFTGVFGSSMYGQVAIVANVLLEEPVTPDQVRQAVEGPWGMKRLKAHP